jgi:hypothetical protein
MCTANSPQPFMSGHSASVRLPSRERACIEGSGGVRAADPMSVSESCGDRYRPLGY